MFNVVQAHLFFANLNENIKAKIMQDYSPLVNPANFHEWELHTIYAAATRLNSQRCTRLNEGSGTNTSASRRRWRQFLRHSQPQQQLHPLPPPTTTTRRIATLPPRLVSPLPTYLSTTLPFAVRTTLQFATGESSPKPLNKGTGLRRHSVYLALLWRGGMASPTGNTTRLLARPSQLLRLRRGTR